MLEFETFILAIDRQWPAPRGHRVPLRVLGSVALMLQTDYQRGTNDGDVLETANMAGRTKDLLVTLAGKGTRLAVQHGMYLDVVPNGLPFLPARPHWCPCAELNVRLETLEVEVLDVIDVVVSKLKRFHAKDRADIQAMVDRELVPHDVLLIRRHRLVEDPHGGRPMNSKGVVQPKHSHGLAEEVRVDFSNVRVHTPVRSEAETLSLEVAKCHGVALEGPSPRAGRRNASSPLQHRERHGECSMSGAKAVGRKR